jgi:tRNA-binding protein
MRRPPSGHGQRNAPVKLNAIEMVLIPFSNVIALEDFQRVDMRVGRVLEVGDFPQARVPAWRLRIDFRPELGERSSSAQLTHYGREQLEGRLVVAVVNLPARRVGPFLSEVLVLGALDPQRGVVLLEPAGGAQPGSPIA